MSMSSGKKAVLWVAAVLICAVAGFLFVGEKYFNGFRNPNCVSNCGDTAQPAK
jgi:hypothetical protein